MIRKQLVIFFSQCSLGVIVDWTYWPVSRASGRLLAIYLHLQRQSTQEERESWQVNDNDFSSGIDRLR